jgi:hypothetical protein
MKNFVRMPIYRKAMVHSPMHFEAFLTGHRQPQQHLLTAGLRIKVPLRRRALSFLHSISLSPSTIKSSCEKRLHCALRPSSSG